MPYPFEINISFQRGRQKMEIALPPLDKTTVVIGPNGAGKSSLFKALLGVIPIHSGDIKLGEDTLYSSTLLKNAPPQARRIGFVPQNYGLFPHLSVQENILFGVEKKKDSLKSVALRIMEDLGVAHLSEQKAKVLSGGESQRVSVARALAISPRALLLDEPMSALDPGTKRRVRSFLAERIRSLNVSTLLSTHDIEDVRLFADHVVVIENGHVTQVGPPHDLKSHPKSAFVEEFFSPEHTEEISKLNEIKKWEHR